MRYKMTIDSPFINPVWFSTNHHKIRGEVLTVQDDGRIHYQGEKLCFVEEALPPGSVVVMDSGNWFWAELKEHYDARKQEAKRRQEEENQRVRDRRNQIRAKADDFHSRLRFPVEYTVGIKTVLSGLSENSWGDGRNRSTVYHLLLKEDFQRGRLKRNKSDFLCTSQSGTNGKFWVSAIEHHFDGDGKKYTPEITCKQCLKLLNKYLEPSVQKL